jgi:hypothetical protein
MSEHAQQRHPHSGPEDDGSPGRPAGTPGHVRGQGQALDGHRAPRPGGPPATGDSCARCGSRQPGMPGNRQSWGFTVSETDTHLTYMIDIVLTTEFSLATASVR